MLSGLKLAIALAVTAFVGTSALAADMAVKAPPPAPIPPPAPSWTGFYIGGDIGGAWMSDPNYSFADLGNAAFNTCAVCDLPYSSPTLTGSRRDGLLGGIFGGYNWQLSPRWVAGVEGDISWTTLSASASGPLFSDFLGDSVTIGPISGSNLSFHTDVQWLASARGRLGWLIAPNLLIYGTGGAAWGHFKTTANASCNVANSGCFFNTFLVGAPFSNASTETGWVAGGGLEWQIFSHLRARLEYLYYRFNDAINGTAPFISSGGAACVGPGPCLAAYGASSVNIQTVRGGVSYAF
jgi:outer membrane immunogenic protein